MIDTGNGFCELHNVLLEDGFCPTCSDTMGIADVEKTERIITGAANICDLVGKSGLDPYEQIASLEISVQTIRSTIAMKTYRLMIENSIRSSMQNLVNGGRKFDT